MAGNLAAYAGKEDDPCPGAVFLIDPLEDPRWDRFVAKHPLGWITHLSGWKKVLETSFSHMKGYYLAIPDRHTGEILAGLPVFEVRSWLTGRRMVSVPFATLCDPLVSTSGEMKELIATATELSDRLKTAYLEIRTFASHPLMQEAGLGMRTLFKHHYLAINADPEDLKKSFHRTCVRQRITRAVNSGVHLRVAETREDLDLFYALYVAARRRIGLPPQPLLFFRMLWDVFHPAGEILLLFAEWNERTIGGLLLFRFKDRLSAEYLASDEGFRDMSPDHFLFWEAIRSAHRSGCSVFDFGRTSPLNQTLMDFKGRWGTVTTDLPCFYYPERAGNAIQERRDSLPYRLVMALCRRAPEPALDYLGRLCYRHMG
jgi:hypothetical protein